VGDAYDKDGCGTVKSQQVGRPIAQLNVMELTLMIIGVMGRA
jgi:hypothetical protein